jgi:phosphoglycolate phosphatase
MKMKYLGVIFDLDGTLIDTLADIAAYMNQALKLRGFPELPVEAYRKKVGWGIKRLAYLSLPSEARNEETAGMIASDAARFYGETPLVHSRLYPGISELLSVLRTKKIKTAILTNKQEPIAQKLVAALFPAGTFDYIQGETEGKPRKPDPASVWDLLIDFDLVPSKIIFAGDSEIDMETAVAAGCFALGVSWGYRPSETLIKAGAKRVIDKPSEVLDFF